MIDTTDGTTLLIWDSVVQPPAGDWKVMMWRGSTDKCGRDVISVAKLIEENADELKHRYLAWIYEIGELPVKGRRLVDHLGLRDGFSYWWMTLLSEKCNYAKSPYIDDAIRLIAFEQWARNRTFASIALATANKPLAECIGSWCDGLGIGFHLLPLTAVADNVSSLKRLYRSLPHFFQALISLFYHVVSRWPLRGVGLKNWRQTEGKISFVSYTANLVAGAVQKGRFESRYWAHLPDTLLADGHVTNWLHIYAKDAVVPNCRKAAAVIRRFNNEAQGKQVHVFLNSFMGVSIIFKTLFDWMRLVKTSIRLRDALSVPKIGTMALWPLFRTDWQRSLFGAVAMGNVLYLNLFEAAMKNLPKQTIGVYLQENQGWEFAFIHAWKAAGHGRLTGAPHSSVRYWDLRYFFDKRSYDGHGANAVPLPDIVAVNGPVALKTYSDGGYPEDGLVEVEALRYLHLAKAKPNAHAESNNGTKNLRILVLGDYLPRYTNYQMRLLEQAAECLPSNTSIIVKPHPICPIRPFDYPRLKMDVTMEPVDKLLPLCDVAYTSSTTSAALDAYISGVPVVCALDRSTLNLSPLRGQGGVFYASSPEELARELIEVAHGKNATEAARDFFRLDPTLPRWKKVLAQGCLQ